MNLWILRHAKTVPDPPPGKTDHERPLAPRGRRDADALGHRLADPGFGTGGRPALVLCSTATRTVQTAERVLAALHHPPDVEYRRTLYGASPDQVLDELRGVEDGVGTVMVVGHNPAAHDLVVAMGAEPAPGGISFPTCALAVYGLPVEAWSDVAPGTGTLLGLFAPPY
ncbi:MAG: SixA phosphatase family protein [Acidimicrobiales bacterium]